MRIDWLLKAQLELELEPLPLEASAQAIRGNGRWSKGNLIEESKRLCLLFRNRGKVILSPMQRNAES